MLQHPGLWIRYPVLICVHITGIKLFREAWLIIHLNGTLNFWVNWCYIQKLNSNWTVSIWAVGAHTFAVEITLAGTQAWPKHKFSGCGRYSRGDGGWSKNKRRENNETQEALVWATIQERAMINTWYIPEWYLSILFLQLHKSCW